MNEPRIECTSTRVFEVWKPRMKTQWNATGSVQRIASRPDQRWITFTGAPATIHGMTRFSRPKIHLARPGLPKGHKVVLGDFYNGQTIYSQKCAACHGQNAEGGVGPKLAGLRISLERAQAQIEAGGSAMPGGLVKGQADRDVLAYLATILATP